MRVIHAPEPELQILLRRVLRTALDQLPQHPMAFAYRNRTSIVECAHVHLRADTVIRLDIADFFTSVRERYVFEALMALTDDEWLPLGRPSRLAAHEMARLTTVTPDDSGAWLNRGTGTLTVDDRARPRSYPYKGQREGFLPQGAPTSGAISNLVMRPVDEAIFQVAEKLGLRYTRYSDDLYFSSRRRVLHHTVDALVSGVRPPLAELGLHLNAHKTRVARGGARRTVLGMLVDGHTLRLPREQHRNIELHLRGADRHGLEHHAESRGFDSVESLERHVSGLIGWAQHVEPMKGATYRSHWHRTRSRSSAAANPQVEHADPTVSVDDSARASIDRLLAQGHAFRQSKDYAEFIGFIGRFRGYSPFNAAMVRLQKPGSRFVATEQKWRTKYRRVIRPGGQPLVMLRPGGPYMVVYDVSDTEALPGSKPLPRHVTDPLAADSSLNSATVERLWKVTIDNAIRHGIRVTLVDNSPAHAGSARWSRLEGHVTRPGKKSGATPETYSLTHEIEVSRKLSAVDQYVTLVHELAHIYCGHLGTPDVALWPSRRGGVVRDEVEAESVAFIVMCRLDPQFTMGDYLLGYLSNSTEIPDGVSLQRMMQVASDIMQMGQRRLKAGEI
ncbi:hypothetical protein C7S10_01600 [Nocardioides currus]|uniref:RNA-directed DNA polymerase n=2 Tax=Nocardioides currus TaxID=2133958 RepID=A0A2R7Z2S8_9ACTN|nr:hypothetical protein C7S10_01600 [Nocardioides currus]